jgi:hypothetical protein
LDVHLFKPATVFLSSLSISKELYRYYLPFEENALRVRLSGAGFHENGDEDERQTEDKGYSERETATFHGASLDERKAEL